jgi:tetratricopeptide (TPR) repeat protein
VIYSATRRRSLAATAINLIGPTLMAAAALLAVTFTSLIPSDVPIYLLTLWIAAALVFCTVTHEAGHLAVALLVGRPVRKVLIGRGATILTARPGGLRVQVCANLLGGGAVYFSAVDDTSTGANVAVSAAGPAVNILTGLIALAAAPAAPWMGTLALAGLLLGAGNAIPSRFDSGGREHLTDGTLVLRLLRGRARGAAFFEGEDLAEDGQRVTIRSIEEAMDSESEQLTEVHLLAALDREAELHAVLAPARVEELIARLPGPPSSIDVRPVRSPVVEDVYKVTFRIGRDLGVARPNAACLCQGLMSVPSEVGSRLKQAGVDEAALTELARRSQDDAPHAEPGPRSVLPDLPLERWGTMAGALLDLAFTIAQTDNSGEVATQHLVAALVARPTCRAGLALQRLGFELHRYDRAVPPAQPSHPPSLTPEAQSAIASALLRTGATHACGTGELLLGLADGARSMAAALFQQADVDATAILGAVAGIPRETSEPAPYSPAMRRMWELRAGARLGAGRYEDSRADYLVLERHAPTEEVRAVNQNNIAWVSLMSGDPSLRADALERSRAAVAAKPDQPSFQGTYAFALMEDGRSGEAAELLERVIALQTRPRDRALELCLLGMCRARLGDPQAARRHLAEAEAIDPRCALMGRTRAEVAGSPILR